MKKRKGKKEVYGFELKNGELVENKKEIKIVKLISKLYNEGTTLRDIVDFLILKVLLEDMN